MTEQMGALIEQKLRNLLPQGMLPTAVSETAACPVAITDNPEFQRLSATLEAKTADIEMHLEDLSAKQNMYEALLAEHEELKQRLKQEFERTYGLGFIAGSRGGNQLAVACTGTTVSFVTFVVLVLTRVGSNHYYLICSEFISADCSLEPRQG